MGSATAPRGLALYGDKLIFIKADGWAFTAQEAELVALDARTGELVWRHYTVPAAGEPGVETWEGTSYETGGSPTWTTGCSTRRFPSMH